MVGSVAMQSLVALVALATVLAQPASTHAHKGDGGKRGHRPPSPDDLFWANRGKKSVDMDELDKRGGLTGARQLRPNSLMAMMLPEREARQGKRSGQALRPNSFLLMHTPGGKRTWNAVRPNNYMFPSKPGKRDGNMKNLKPNGFLFPIPKRDQLGSETFFAGRGKKSEAFYVDDLEDDAWEDDKRGSEADWEAEDAASFFAGRGRRADNEDDLEVDKREAEDTAFFAGRGKKNAEDEMTFFAGRG